MKNRNADFMKSSFKDGWNEFLRRQRRKLKCLGDSRQSGFKLGEKQEGAYRDINSDLTSVEVILNLWQQTLQLLPQRTLRTQQQGFALVLMCMVLPIVLLISIFVYVGTTQIEIKSTLNQLCRQELLSAQNRAAHIFQKIRDSNTDPHTPHAVQEKLLRTLVQNSDFSLNKSKIQLHNTLLNYQNKLAPLMSLSQIEIQGTPNSLSSIQMNIHNLLSLSNSIHFNENFERLQSLTLSWRYQLKLSPNFILDTPWSQNFEGHCSATLKKEKSWSPILYEDKFFWKPS